MSITHLMFDIETLGLDDSTVITSLAVVPFKFEEQSNFLDLVEKGLFIKFNIEDQIKNFKRTTTQSTIDWWKQQSEDARTISIKPSKQDVEFVDGLNQMVDYISTTGIQWKNSYNWARGSNFDFPKLEHAYRHTDIKCPFNTWRVRDVRTYMDILYPEGNGNYELRDGLPKGFIAHHSLHDAARDALKMQEVYQNNL